MSALSQADHQAPEGHKLMVVEGEILGQEVGKEDSHVVNLLPVEHNAVEEKFEAYHVVQLPTVDGHVVVLLLVVGHVVLLLVDGGALLLLEQLQLVHHTAERLGPDSH